MIFIEHKALYGKQQRSRYCHSCADRQGRRTARPGRDVTIVTYGNTVHASLQAAAQLAAENIEAEVIDLRSLQPWDEQAVYESVSRTHRVVVVHEAVKSFGSGAEIAASITENVFYELDAPVMRVGSPFMPVPFATSLEAQYVIKPADIADAVRLAMAGGR